ncbi:MAG TPA: general secretion pathway protein GspG, partial [Parachlamydiaceae bacterium]|nr:general secretion pathway protein GspG [Parachlamydiaceae bacterium]
NKKLRKKSYVTLIEMMIVMFLIALISGVVAYNYRGTLDEGKAFKTAADIQNIENILNLRVASDDEALGNVESDWKQYLRQSPLVQNANSLMKDGWGNDYQVNVVEGEVKVTSSKLEQYRKTNKTMFK